MAHLDSRWLRALSLLLPRGHRAEILGDLVEERAALMTRGRSRIATACWLAAHLVRSAVATRRHRPPALPLAGAGMSAGNRAFGRTMRLVAGIGRDLFLAWRRLRRSPGFTLIATLTLALGIGANTAVFSVLDPLLLRHLPVTRPDELVLLHSAGTLHTIEISERAAFERYSAEHDVLAGVLGDAGLTEYPTSYGGVRTTARAELVSPNYFSVLGVRPFAGRLFSPDVDAAGSPVVIGFNYWRRVFGGDPTAVERTLIVNGHARTIVGVAPEAFHGVTVDSSPDLYLPFAPESTPGWLTVVGRLKPDVSPAQARAALEPVFNQVVHASDLPEIERQQAMARLLVTPVPRGLSAVRTTLAVPAWVLMAVVGLVLIVACANVANLLLTRATGRRREMAVELALGATRAHLIRELVAESAWLATAGAVAGILAARLTSGALVASLSTRRVPVELTAGLGGRVLVFTVLVLGFTILLCGVLPAVTATRADVMHDLKGRGSSPEPGGRWRVGQLLIVGQIAVSVTLLAGAGLLVRSLVNLQTFDVGLDRDRVLSVSLADEMTTRPPGQVANVLSKLLERTRGLPGVRSASLSALALFTGDELGINVAVEGARQTVASPHAYFNAVAPGYFATVGIPLVAGRDFSTDDDAPSRPVVIVNRTMARRYFGDESPLGKHLRFVEGNRPPMEIVGVVADSIHNDVREPALDFLYLYRPSRQSAVRRAVLLVRTDPSAGADVAGPVQKLVHSLDAGIAVTSVKTIRQSIDESLRDDRVISALCSTFSVLALTVAALGLYGVLSVTVARQTKEIGVRIALGADTRHIVRLVTAQGMRLTLVGLVLGMAGALASTSVLTTMLFGLHRTDLLTLGAVAVTLLAATTMACYVPARRAMHVDPVTALRQM
jgi:predicted permease